MPKIPAPPRLILYGPDDKYNARPKKTFKNYVWYITCPGQNVRSTGIIFGEKRDEQIKASHRAQFELEKFVAERNKRLAADPEQHMLLPSEMFVADCLGQYLVELEALNSDPGISKDTVRAGFAIKALLTFFGGKKISSVNATSTKEYARFRKVKPATSRRELGVLNAAMNFCQNEGRLSAVPPIKLPLVPKVEAEFLRRPEAAVLLLCARKLRHARHYLPDYILLGLYFGVRKSAALDVQLRRNDVAGNIDLGRGVVDFNGKRTATKKVRPRACIPRRMRHFLKAFAKKRKKFLIERRGAKIDDIGNSFGVAARAAAAIFSQMAIVARAAEERGETVPRLNRADPPLSADECEEAAERLTNATPHILRHTCITWLLQQGISTWDVGGFVGDKEATISKHYGHHCPDQMQAVVNAHRVRSRDRSRDSGVVPAIAA
jgi:integrase